MTVYVDRLRLARVTRARNRWQARPRLWCHLVADSVEELHDFAARIGLRRAWSQGDHYDLTAQRRAKAVAVGAAEATREQTIAVRRAMRLAGEDG